MVCVHSNKGREIVLRQTKLFYGCVLKLKSIWSSFVFVCINVKAEANASTIDVNKIYIFEWQFWYRMICANCIILLLFVR